MEIPPITVTLTMCCRPQLLRKTLDSLLLCMLDKEHVTRWIAMDDGSATADLYEMARRYPFFEVICNDLKGHPSALNALLKEVQTDYFFHLEDDWLFKTPARLIEQCWDVMHAEPKIGSVGLRGFNFGSKPAPGPTGSCYGLHGPPSPWPGFSLNPGLFDRAKVLAAGPFHEGRSAFEYHYAQAYRSKGYAHAYLNPPAGGRWIEHLGNQSAYSLNHTTR